MEYLRPSSVFVIITGSLLLRTMLQIIRQLTKFAYQSRYGGDLVVKCSKKLELPAQELLHDNEYTLKT